MMFYSTMNGNWRLSISISLSIGPKWSIEFQGTTASIASFAIEYGSSGKSEFHKRVKFAKFLLLREFVRQPFRANSVETMGLASFRFKHIEDIQDHQLPSSFVRHGGTLSDWRDFLYIAMTRFARQNWCVDVDWDVMHWISHKATTKSIKPPGQQFDRIREIAWPGQSKPIERRLLVRLLAQGLGLSLENRGDRDDIDECLARAWQHFQGICHQTEGGFRLDFERASLMPVTEAFICPVVKSVLRDRTFRGLSPNPLTPHSEFLKAAWEIPSGGGVVRNMMATQDGNLVLACSGVDRIALVDVQ